MSEMRDERLQEFNVILDQAKKLKVYKIDNYAPRDM